MSTADKKSGRLRTEKSGNCKAPSRERAYSGGAREGYRCR